MILVGIGANLEFGNQAPLQNMENVLTMLDASSGLKVVGRSRWYRTSPVGKVDQPDYFNGVAALASDPGPLDLMRLLLDIERQFGRIRGERWGPRTMDLDLLDFDGQVLDLEEEGITLHLPHPRMHERAFVLRPLGDVAPNWRHPVLNKSAAEFLAEISSNQAVQVVGEGAKSGD